jgi:biotin synthase
MCYAIPGKVVEIESNIALIDYFGEKRKVLNELAELEIDDYVYAQGGVVINKVPQTEALKILAFWKEKFFELKLIDQNISQVHSFDTVKSSILGILQKVNLKQAISKEEWLSLLRVKKKDELQLLLQTANNLRQKEHDNACCVHGIIEFSNYCQNNCYYCGIRKSSAIKRYRLSLNEIIQIAKYAVQNLGFKALVLQSGEDFWYDQKKLIKIIQEIRKLNVLVFLSIGERKKEIYHNLYRAGARGILLRFETSNQQIFNQLRPGTNWEQRVELIRYLKKRGFIIATGFLVGLPGETKKDIINNILLTKSLQPDMYSFGPLIPTLGTPLAATKKVNKNLILKTIALTRLIDRESKILVTTALETLNKQAKKEGLMAGANSLMINVTPANIRDWYTIYSPKAGNEQRVEETIDQTIQLLYSLGRAPTDLGVG